MIFLLHLLMTSATQGGDARTHSLRYFRLGVSDSSQGIPEFVSVGYVDSHPITSYDSDRRQKMPQAHWMEENLGSDHWEKYTQLLRGWQQTFKVELRALQNHYNHTGETPLLSGSHKKSSTGITTLICRAYSFYPPEITMTWIKNGEPITQEIEYGDILPSGDGTYQTWVSIDIDPQSKDHYSCQVEHNDMLKVLHVPVESKTSSPFVEIVFGLTIIALFLIGLGIFVYRRKQSGLKEVSYISTPVN
ncbi:major histocompatibility complex class I-related gene protein isoform X3 [Vombatus ursinus]|uniref:major histocompatibility complex class I-related gene protein isoform X3 n=1 Tax=Vombatus ursinus TaxID=29139 RepID=UPI000FFD87B2|nr:major histocompatibility complex class I-related gene protein isoform X3 [Vombatus ursinus]